MAKKTDETTTKRDYFDAIADVLRQRGLVDPRHLDDVTVEAVRKEFGV